MHCIWQEEVEYFQMPAAFDEAGIQASITAFLGAEPTAYDTDAGVYFLGTSDLTTTVEDVEYAVAVWKDFIVKKGGAFFVLSPERFREKCIPKSE